MTVDPGHRKNGAAGAQGWAVNVVKGIGRTFLESSGFKFFIEEFKGSHHMLGPVSTVPSQRGLGNLGCRSDRAGAAWHGRIRMPGACDRSPCPRGFTFDWFGLHVLFPHEGRSAGNALRCMHDEELIRRDADRMVSVLKMHLDAPGERLPCLPRLLGCHGGQNFLMIHIAQSAIAQPTGMDHVENNTGWPKPNTRVTSRQLVCPMSRTARTRRAAELSHGDSGVHAQADVSPGRWVPRRSRIQRPVATRGRDASAYPTGSAHTDSHEHR